MRSGPTPGQVATEDTVVPPDFPFPRVSEQTALTLVAEGVNASVMRLPQVHNTIKQGLVTYLIAVAREKGVSAYVEEGRNRWAAASYSERMAIFANVRNPFAQSTSRGCESLGVKVNADIVRNL